MKTDVAVSHLSMSVSSPNAALADEPVTQPVGFQAELVEAQPEPKPTESNSHQAGRRAELQIFFSTFFTIFLAELGDKTQLTTLLMSAESHDPLTVFFGAGAALVATSLIGVWLGCWLAKRVAPRTLEVAAGGLLLLIAAQLAWEVIHL
jgi:putative Ca2+/H+ antiporter (TMEM165/GDT1 family)